MELPKRKNIRHKKHNYNSVGAYFITICVKERRCILSEIVGTGVPDGPFVELSSYGQIADKYIKQFDEFYSDIHIEKYVIMPNHIHLLLRIPYSQENTIHGPSRTPVPTEENALIFETKVQTVQNSIISRFVSTFKRFCNKEYGENIWQPRSYDHIVRNKYDYDEISEYIDKNPLNWMYDNLYPNI